MPTSKNPVVPCTAVLTSIARAVWNRDLELARVLILTQPLAQRHLHLVHGLPALAHPLEFADVFAHEKTQELSAALSAAKPTSGLKRPSRRAATKKLELWSPFGGRFVVAGFLASDGTVVKDPPGMVELLRQAWAPVFARKPTDSNAAEDICDAWVRRIDTSLVSPPSVDDFLGALAAAKNSAPGPDGLPHAAWRAGGRLSAETLLGIEEMLRSGRRLPLELPAGGPSSRRAARTAPPFGMS